MRRQIKDITQFSDSRLLYDKKMPGFGYFIIIIVLGLLISIVIWSMYTPKTYTILSEGIVESRNKNYVMSPYTGTISELYIKEVL